MKRLLSYVVTALGCPFVLVGAGMIVLQTVNHGDRPAPTFIPAVALPREGFPGSLLYTAMGAAIAASGVGIIRWSERMRAADAPTVLAADSRPPVLLLRSFEVDGASVDGKFSFFNVTNLIKVMDVTLPGESFEERLARSLHPIGPVVAIGRPSERLPQLGAAREYLDNSEWQARVSQLLEECRAVFVIAGASMGLRWELEQIRDRGFSKKATILFPPETYEFLGEEAAIDRTLEEVFRLEVSIAEMRGPGKSQAILLDLQASPPKLITAKNRQWKSYETALAQLGYDTGRT